MSQFSIVLALFFAAIVSGCGNQKSPVAPAKGQVFYQGKALGFGSVMFQPTAGPPARGAIQPDGTFELSTYGNHDGAIVGQHKVRIACVESQRGLNGPRTKPGDATGGDKPLIPLKYSHFVSSGLSVEVKEHNDPFIWELVD